MALGAKIKGIAKRIEIAACERLANRRSSGCLFSHTTLLFDLDYNRLINFLSAFCFSRWGAEFIRH